MQQELGIYSHPLLKRTIQGLTCMLNCLQDMHEAAKVGETEKVKYRSQTVWRNLVEITSAMVFKGRNKTEISDITMNDIAMFGREVKASGMEKCISRAKEEFERQEHDAGLQDASEALNLQDLHYTNMEVAKRTAPNFHQVFTEEEFSTMLGAYGTLLTAKASGEVEKFGTAKQIRNNGHKYKEFWLNRSRMNNYTERAVNSPELANTLRSLGVQHMCPLIDTYSPMAWAIGKYYHQFKDSERYTRPSSSGKCRGMDSAEPEIQKTKGIIGLRHVLKIININCLGCNIRQQKYASTV